MKPRRGSIYVAPRPLLSPQKCDTYGTFLIKYKKNLIRITLLPFQDALGLPGGPFEPIECIQYSTFSIKIKKNLIRVPLLPTKRNTYAVLWHRTQYVCHFCPPVWPSHGAKVSDVPRFCLCGLGIPRGGPAECPSDRCRRAIHVYT